MFPQPMNQIGFSTSLSLPVGVDQGRGDGFARRFPAPEYKLEDGVEALAFLESGFDNGFRLVEGKSIAFARVQDGRVTEHDQAGARPHLEMAAAARDENEALKARIAALEAKAAPAAASTKRAPRPKGSPEA